MDIKEIKNRITRHLSKDGKIKFIYLFGSQVKNQVAKQSDIDLAVFLDEKVNPNQRFGLRLELINQISKLLKTDKIDLVILNDCPISLGFRVIHDGLLIYSDDELKRTQFEAKIMSLYFDRQYYYRRHIRIALKRIALEGIL